MNTFSFFHLCLQPLYIITFMKDVTEKSGLHLIVCTHTLKRLIPGLNFWSRWLISHPHKLLLTSSESTPVTCEDYEADFGVSTDTVSPVCVCRCMCARRGGLATSCPTVARRLPIAVRVSDQAVVLPRFCLPWSSHCGLQRPAVDQAPVAHTHGHTHASPAE